jgi:hypothetical protein
MSTKRAAKSIPTEAAVDVADIPGSSSTPIPEDLQRALDAATKLLDWSEELHRSAIPLQSLPPTWPIAARELISTFSDRRQAINDVLAELDAVGDWAEISDVSARPAHLAAVKFAESAIERFYMAILISIGSEQTVAMPQNADGQVAFPADVDARLAHLLAFGEDVYSPQRTASVQQYFAMATPIRPPQRSRLFEQLAREAKLVAANRVEERRAAERLMYNEDLVGNHVNNPTSPLSAYELSIAIFGLTPKNAEGEVEDNSECNDRTARRALIRDWMRKAKLPARIADSPRDHYIVDGTQLSALAKVYGGAFNDTPRLHSP